MSEHVQDVQDRWTVVWDLGGVILEWGPAEVVRRAFPELTADDASLAELTHLMFEDFVLGSDWSEFDRGALEEPDLVERMAARAGVDRERLAAMVRGVPASLHRLPDALALARRLREAGHRVVFLSNMPVTFADDLDADEDFRSAFDDGLYSGRLGLVKPEPAIFAAAAEHFGVAPGGHRVLFLDDRPVNLDVPRGLGWTCLVFSSVAQAEADLVRLGLFG